MSGRFYAPMVLVIVQMVFCDGKNWMFSKSWIKDYRIDVKYGLPHQHMLTEFNMETHKIGIVQRDEARYLYEGHYDIEESTTILKSTKNVAVRNKGKKYVGQLISDVISVPRNLTHPLPSVRVDMILLDKATDETINFIGLLETPEKDNYSGLVSGLRSFQKNASISYEFVLCGNNQWKSMLSIGYMEIHQGNSSESRARKYLKHDVAVIDRYLFAVVLKSIVINDTSLATCRELNVQSPVFDNSVPGIYLPFTIFRRFMAAINEHANKYDFPENMKIWERRKHACFEGPVDWKNIPKIRFELFLKQRGTVSVTYSGASQVKRYYTENSEENTYCYIFAIRKADDDRLVFGRAAFEGVKLIFNRTGEKISFVENKCCGPVVKLRRNGETMESMDSCLPISVKSMTTELDTYWIWVMVTAIILAILACLLSIPRSLHRGSFARPTIHIFIPQTRALKRDKNSDEKCTETME